MTLGTPFLNHIASQESQKHKLIRLVDILALCDHETWDCEARLDGTAGAINVCSNHKRAHDVIEERYVIEDAGAFFVARNPNLPDGKHVFIDEQSLEDFRKHLQCVEVVLKVGTVKN